MNSVFPHNGPGMRLHCIDGNHGAPYCRQWSSRHQRPVAVDSDHAQHEHFARSHLQRGRKPLSGIHHAWLRGLDHQRSWQAEHIKRHHVQRPENLTCHNWPVRHPVL